MTTQCSHLYYIQPSRKALVNLYHTLPYTNYTIPYQLYYTIPTILYHTNYTIPYQLYYTIPTIPYHTNYTIPYQLYYTIPTILYHTNYTIPYQLYYTIPTILYHTNYTMPYQLSYAGQCTASSTGDTIQPTLYHFVRYFKWEGIGPYQIWMRFLVECDHVNGISKDLPTIHFYLHYQLTIPSTFSSLTFDSHSLTTHSTMTISYSTILLTHPLTILIQLKMHCTAIVNYLYRSYQ